jgi:hypothetical protein
MNYGLFFEQGVSLGSQADAMQNSLISFLASHVAIDQPVRLQSSSLMMTINKVNLDSTNSFYEGFGKVSLPSFCDMTKNCSQKGPVNVVVCFRVFVSFQNTRYF